MRLGFRRRICVRFNEVLSDTYTRHSIVKLVDTKGKWRNIFVEDTRATQGPLQKKGQGAQFIQRSLQICFQCHKHLFISFVTMNNSIEYEVTQNERGVSSLSSQIAGKGHFVSIYVNRAQQEHRNVFSHEDKSCPPRPRWQRARGDHLLCLRTPVVRRPTIRIASKPERSLLLKISPMIDEKWCNV